MKPQPPEIQRAFAVFSIGVSLTAGVAFAFAQSWGLAALVVGVGLLVGVSSWPRRPMQ
jgi:hypothetical protein